MLTMADFLTVAGATAITTALVTLLKAAWPQAPEPWSTWGVSEGTVFAGGFLHGPLTVRAALVLVVSGMVVAAAVLGPTETKHSESGSKTRSDSSAEKDTGPKSP